MDQPTIDDLADTARDLADNNAIEDWQRALCAYILAKQLAAVTQADEADRWSAQAAQLRKRYLNLAQ